MNKQTKYNQIRAFALLIAGLPGGVLIPFALAGLVYTFLPRGQVVDLISGGLTIFSTFALMPSIFSMFGLLIVAIVTAFRKPTDPKSPTPKSQLLQICLAVVAAAMPTAALLIIWSQTFEECEANCFIFGDPAMVPLGITYVLTWLAIATIWLRNRKQK